MITIETTIEVSTKLLGEIAITAAEGGRDGIGYWAQIDSYDYGRWSDEESGGCVEVPEDFVFYTILDNKEDGVWDWDDPDSLRQPITPRVLAKGIGLLMKSQRVDLEDVDAWVADLIVQYGTFGEQVYG